MKSGNSSWRDKLHTVNLSRDEEKEVAIWYADQDRDAWTCVEEMIDDFWSVRITPPGGGDDFWASASCRDSKSELDGHTFSVHYPDVDTVVILLYYVVNVMLKRGDHDIFTEISPKDWLKTSP